MADNVKKAKILIESVQTLTESAINKAGFNKKRKAVIQSLNADGTANILLNNELYEHVAIRAGLKPEVGEVVWVEIPNNDSKDMYIDTAKNTIVGNGDTLHYHNNLLILDTITQDSINKWNSVENKADKVHTHTISDITDFQHTHSTYVHNQISPSATWIINHNLNKFPSVTVVDSAGTVVIGDIQYVDENKIIITFLSEFSGKVYLN